MEDFSKEQLKEEDRHLVKRMRELFATAIVEKPDVINLSARDLCYMKNYKAQE